MPVDPLAQSDSQRSLPDRISDRRAIRMTDAEVDAFLSRPLTARIGTFSPDNSIHLVAMTFAVFDGQVVMQSHSRAQKVLNLRRDPRITVLVDSGYHYLELEGVMLRGTARLLEDPELVWRIAFDYYRRYLGIADPGQALIERACRNYIAIVVDPESVISWNHHKLPDTPH